MLRKHVLTLCVFSLLVMGKAVTARAGDSAAPSYPDWAAAVVPAYPHALPSSGPVIPTMYGIATTDSMTAVVGVVQSAGEGRMVGKRRGKYLVCKERRGKDPDLSDIFDDSGNEKPGTRIALTRYR